MMQVRRDDVPLLTHMIDRQTIYRYLKMDVDPKWDAVLDKILDDLLRIVQLRALVVSSEIAFLNVGLRLKALEYNILSLDLKEHLEGEDNVFIVFCSLGEKVSQKIRQEMMLNPSHGVIYDACASELAEAYAAYLNGLLAENSIRFSPGYGDFSLTNQHEIAEILGTEKHVGIHVKTTGFMHPEKSVCFVLGTNGRLKGNANQCSDCKTCEKINCLYRRKDE